MPRPKSNSCLAPLNSSFPIREPFQRSGPLPCYLSRTQQTRELTHQWLLREFALSKPKIAFSEGAFLRALTAMREQEGRVSKSLSQFAGWRGIYGERGRRSSPDPGFYALLGPIFAHSCWPKSESQSNHSSRRGGLRCMVGTIWWPGIF
jgi:hypothetical protein